MPTLLLARLLSHSFRSGQLVVISSIFEQVSFVRVLQSPPPAVISRREARSLWFMPAVF